MPSEGHGFEPSASLGVGGCGVICVAMQHSWGVAGTSFWSLPQGLHRRVDEAEQHIGKCWQVVCAVKTQCGRIYPRLRGPEEIPQGGKEVVK